MGEQGQQLRQPNEDVPGSPAMGAEGLWSYDFARARGGPAQVPARSVQRCRNSPAWDSGPQ
eukprot:2856279-Pyramimonas_sp.AAC.1